MPVSYQYDSEKRVISTSATGELTLAEIGTYVERVIQDPKIDRAVEIVDFNNVDSFRFSFSEGSQLKTIFQQAVNAEKIKSTVIVAQNDFRFGMARMFSVVVGFLDNYKINAVRTIEEAEVITTEMLKEIPKR